MDTKVKEKVKAAKEAGHSVFAVTIGGKQFVYRSFNRTEYREIQNSVNVKAEEVRKKTKDETELAKKLDIVREESEEELVLYCLIDPEVNTPLDLQALPGGAVPTLSELMMQASGFGVESEPEQL